VSRNGVQRCGQSSEILVVEIMSDAKDSTTSAYYAGSSYQQGSNSAVVAQDQAYAERLQQQEFGNAQQVRRAVH